MFSAALYLRLARTNEAYFRFLLDAHEGLALSSSLGPDASGREALLLRYAPEARPELLRFLAAARAEVELEILAG